MRALRFIWDFLCAIKLDLLSKLRYRAKKRIKIRLSLMYR